MIFSTVKARTVLSARKRSIRELFDRLAPNRLDWIRRNACFYGQDESYMRFLILKGLRVLELGCGVGQLLAALKPSEGVGVDFSPGMIAETRRHYPHLTFHVGDIEEPDVIRGLGGPLDVIVLSDTIGLLDDCETTLANLHPVGCDSK